MLNEKPEEQLDETLDIDELDCAAGGSGKDIPEIDGTVLAILPNATCSVSVGGETVTAYLSGKMRMNFVRLQPGDKVRVQGNRVTYRYKNS